MPRLRTRVALEEGPKLDIRDLRLHSGLKTAVAWSFSTGLIVEGVIQTQDHAGSLILVHDEHQQVIALEALPRHLGGYQWYARCPVTQTRVLTLWKPAGSSIFAGRLAWTESAYRSQFVFAPARAALTKARILRKLEINSESGELRRSRRMRPRRLIAVLSRYRSAVRTLDAYAVRKLGRFSQSQAAIGGTDFD